MKVTQKELINIFSKSESESIYLKTKTPVKLNKKGNPLYKHLVERTTEGEFKFGTSFTKLMNESLSNIDSDKVYETKKLPWGKWVDGAENKVIEHTKVIDKETNETKVFYYLRYYNAIGNINYQYLVDNKNATSEEIETIKEFSVSKKKVSKGQSELGLDESTKVSIQLVSFDNILSVSIDGTEYEIN